MRRLLTPKSAAGVLGVHVDLLDLLHGLGGGPDHVHLSKGQIRYRLDDLFWWRSWINGDIEPTNAKEFEAGAWYAGDIDHVDDLGALGVGRAVYYWNLQRRRQIGGSSGIAD